MLDLPENELLSAYIDGELTVEERAAVERILNENPEAQQLVDELRSLSLRLQALPPYKLDGGLAERVLVAAEREMLAHPATPLPKFHQVDVPQAKAKSWAGRLMRPRNFAWSAVAIFVAVVLMLNESDTKNSPPGSDVVWSPGGVTIEPLDMDRAVEAVENPSIPAVVDTRRPSPAAPEIADTAPPASAPTMVAKSGPEAKGGAIEKIAPGEEGAPPLLILQCELAEGRTGGQSLARLLEEAGIGGNRPIPEGDGSIELTLTTDQLLQVVSQLQKGSGDFSGFSFPLATSKTAPPRIPSGMGSKDSHREDTTAAETPKAPRAEGTISIQQVPAETSATGRNPAESTAAKKVPSRPLPLKDDSTYRVRFVVTKPEKAQKSEPSVER